VYEKQVRVSGKYSILHTFPVLLYTEAKSLNYEISKEVNFGIQALHTGWKNYGTN